MSGVHRIWLFLSGQEGYPVFAVGCKTIRGANPVIGCPSDLVAYATEGKPHVEWPIGRLVTGSSFMVWPNLSVVKVEIPLL
jgi:hypothetical protein